MQAIPWSGRLHALAERFGARVAVRSGHANLSFRQLSQRAHALAAHLGALGVAQGEPIGLSLPNGPDVVWANYGLLVYGAAEAPIAPSLTADEVAWFAGLAGIRRVVSSAARREFFGTLGLEVIAIEDIAADGPAPLAPVPADMRGRCLATSGTTGRPKGVVYTHGRRHAGNELLKSVLPFAPLPGDGILLMTPYSHGVSLLTYAWLDHGAQAVLLDGVQRAPVEAALRGGVAAVFAPPTVINKLAELFPAEHFPGVRCVFTGTQTLTEASYRRAERLFGPVVRITYGKTECVNPITVLAPAETAAYFASEARADGACLGWPAEGVELAIHEEEIWLRARHMANGTIDAAGFHEFPDGWHATGDTGWLDERGRLWLSGRLADVIKTGGYKVQPQEIEAMLSAVPGCGQIVIASLPSDYWGEVIVAATERASEGWIAEAQARVASLSKHKQPRAYVALDALPRNPQGKVNRRDVRAAVLARFELEDGPRPVLRARNACAS